MNIFPEALLIIDEFIKQGAVNKRKVKFKEWIDTGQSIHIFKYEVLKSLESHERLTINSIKLDFKDGYFEDTFLTRYALLVNKKKIKEAEQLLNLMGMKVFEKFIIEGTLDSLEKLLKEKNDKTDNPLFEQGLAFGIDFYENLIVTITITKDSIKLFQSFLNKTLSDYKHGKSNKYDSNVRYKKQKDIFLTTLGKIIEFSEPNSVDLSKERIGFPLGRAPSFGGTKPSNYNFIETALCLEQEGFFTIEDFSIGDLPHEDPEYAVRILVNVNEFILSAYFPKKDNLKNNTLKTKKTDALLAEPPTQENRLIQVVYLPEDKILKIQIDRFEVITFSGDKTPQIIEYFYKNRGSGNWYSANDLKFVTSGQLEKAVKRINRRIDRHTKYFITGVIAVKPKDNPDSRLPNKYRWAL